VFPQLQDVEMLSLRDALSW